MKAERLGDQRRQGSQDRVLEKRELPGDLQMGPLSTDQHLCVRKLPKVRERITQKSGTRGVGTHVRLEGIVPGPTDPAGKPHHDS